MNLQGIDNAFDSQGIPRRAAFLEAEVVDREVIVVRPGEDGFAGLLDSYNNHDSGPVSVLKRDRERERGRERLKGKKEETSATYQARQESSIRVPTRTED